MQEIWISGIKWDEQLQNEEFETWKLWLESLGKITECKIPRFYHYNHKVEKEIGYMYFAMQVKKPTQL